MTPPRHARPRTQPRLLVLIALLMLWIGVWVVQKTRRADEMAFEPQVAAPPNVAEPEAPSWRAAAKKVEEERGEPTGRAARVAVPAELRHYGDTRRFLAIQVATALEQELPLPHDDAGLVEVIRSDGLVELPPLGEDYILYGVGANASEGPLVHVDPRTGAEVPLFPRYDLAEDAARAWQAEADTETAKAAEATAALRKTLRKQASRRRALTAEARQARARATALRTRAQKLLVQYKDEKTRRKLVGEWETLQDQAAAFPDRRYDLDNPKQRRAFRARLLSFLRPAARDMVLEIAKDYHDRYDRPLALTSLVRSLSYQRDLGESNPNATKIDIPPHSTGLAFDVFYRYLTADEQAFVMGRFAALEREGRLEALRENRDHIHALAFPTGRRPPEALIADALGDVGARRVSSRSRSKTTMRASARGRTAVKATRKAATRPPARKPARRRR
jgi:hypothetical protein